ncbi:MAG: hypothetical protein HQK49_00405 [Oligoflexia bacterium]|nr:hypothetical protein [Oligoflexia bacterium]
MDLEQIYAAVDDFCKTSHGSSNYSDDKIFVMGRDVKRFAPFTYLKKKIPSLIVSSSLDKSDKSDNTNTNSTTNANNLLTSSSSSSSSPTNDCLEIMALGMVFASYDFLDGNEFKNWFEGQFSQKFTSKISKDISILYRPNHKTIFCALEEVTKSYQILREEKILLNSKNLSTQLGEWYTKCIFGLKQVKSASQRGFDFELNGKRVEIKVHWGDKSSPKGVKIKKSLLELSDSCIIIYETLNFMIRDICFLDSDFVLRKFSGKGHTIFLKDNDVSLYFFSKSSKHLSKVVNKNALMMFASPQLAMKIEGRL